MMNGSSNSLSIIHRIYHSVHAILWALLVALVATMVINIPRMLKERAIAEHARAVEIANESRAFCEKWGMPAGTDQHASCVRDLHEIRAREDRRVGEADVGL
jgi:hypothetical protein